MDPMTMASAGMGAIGALFKGVTSLFGGNAEAKAAEAQADQARREAGVRINEGLQQGDQAVARAAITSAAGGGGFVGSSLGVLRMLGQQSYANARTEAYKGMTEAQAADYRAAQARSAGLQGLVGGLVGAGGSIAGGLTQNALQGQQAKLYGQIGRAGPGYDPTTAAGGYGF